MWLEHLIAKDPANISLFRGAKSIVKDAIDALSQLPLLERSLHIFWLCGPFILLIERTPADFWLTIIGLVFLARSIFKKDANFLRFVWVRAAFLFWFWCLICAWLSRDHWYSLGETIAWFRFPIFAMATVFWLGRDKRLVYAMLMSTAVGLFLMCLILSAELILVGQQGGRLTWPYGDALPGSYVSKVGLPIFSVMVALAVGYSGRLSGYSGMFALFTLVISLMTGERINFLIRACGGMLAGLLWRPIWHRYLLLIIVEVCAVIISFIFVPQVKSRFVTKFIDQLPTSTESPYAKAMLPGVEVFKSSPTFGVGPGNYRNLCDEIIMQNASYICHPHPHNFYIQLLAETGLVGLGLGAFFVGSIVWSCFVALKRARNNAFVTTAWITPFALFWPVASMADFFGQWNNIFVWTAVALSLTVTVANFSED